MARFRIKNKWKSVLAGILVVATVLGAVMGIAALFKKDTRTIGSTAFSVGALNKEGQFQEYKQSIVSDFFECQGLMIEPDDNATGTYQVFYYDFEKVFLGASKEMAPSDGVYERGGEYRYAKYARVVITPSVPLDEFGVEVASFSIRFWEIAQYARNFVISVDKEQNYPYDVKRNVLKTKDIVPGASYKTFVSLGYEWIFLEDLNESDRDVNTVSALEIPSNAKSVSVFVRADDTTLKDFEVAFANVDKYVIHSAVVSPNVTIGDWLVWDYTLTSECKYFTLEFTGEHELMIFFGYQ